MITAVACSVWLQRRADYYLCAFPTRFGILQIASHTMCTPDRHGVGPHLTIVLLKLLSLLLACTEPETASIALHHIRTASFVMPKNAVIDKSALPKNASGQGGIVSLVWTASCIASLYQSNQMLRKTAMQSQSQGARQAVKG